MTDMVGLFFFMHFLLRFLLVNMIYLLFWALLLRRCRLLTAVAVMCDLLTCSFDCLEIVLTWISFPILLCQVANITDVSGLTIPTLLCIFSFIEMDGQWDGWWLDSSNDNCYAIGWNPTGKICHCRLVFLRCSFQSILVIFVLVTGFVC